MITFKTLTLKNFLSFGAIETTIDFENKGMVLVLGENLDNTLEGKTSNGVGKTTIINGLVFAIYDKPISEISKDNLINNINKKNMVVNITFERNGKVYQVKRGRKTKPGAAGNYVHLFEDGKDVTPDSIANANKLIENIIGFPYEIFIRVVAFSANSTPFLRLPSRSANGSNQTDVIEELFDLKTLSEKAEELKNIIKESQQSLDIVITQNEQIEKEKLRHQLQIEQAELRISNWDLDVKSKVILLKTKITQASNNDIDLKQQQQLNDEIAILISELDIVDAESVTITNQIKEVSKTKKIQKNELTSLENNECPYCQQLYTDTEEKIKECKKSIALCGEKLKTYTDELTKVYGKIDEFDDIIENKKLGLSEHDIDELITLNNQLVKNKQKLVDLSDENNPHIETLKDLNNIKLDSIDDKKLNDLTKLIEHQKFLLKLLTKKDSFIRKALLDKNIPFLNQRLGYYVNGLGLPHLVEFQPDMSVKISQMGRKLDFGNLSNGQQARVNLSLTLAFRDVLLNIHDSINVCMLDEVLDVGLDNNGIERAIKLLKTKADDEQLSMFVISHKDEIYKFFDNQMLIQMKNGFSELR